MASRPVEKAPTLADIIAELQSLESLSGIELAKAVKIDGALEKRVRKAIAAAGNKGVWQAKVRDGMSYKEIKAELGHADDGPVSRAVTAHNKQRRL